MTKAEREQMLRQKLADMKKYENKLQEDGVKYIVGVDEVGRGPLAGPVVAAAVILPEDFDVIGVDDSKKLSEKKRKELFGIITEKALACGVGMRDNLVIDSINILEATKEAMAEAIENAGKQLAERGRAAGDFPTIGHILFDAVTIERIKTPQTSIIKGDTKSVSIAAASIVAKVIRDEMMCKYHEEYPHYAFDSNKGYGTKAHYEGLRGHGLCPIHRKSFLKNL